MWDSSPTKNFLEYGLGPKMDMRYGLMITEARGTFLFAERQYAKVHSDMPAKYALYSLRDLLI
jgi:hypothetical protein